MGQLAEQISRITAKANRLVREYRSLLQENTRLKKELKSSHTAMEEVKRKCTELEMQVKILMASAGHLDAAGRKDLEKRMEQYIREIDRCIASLGD